MALVEVGCNISGGGGVAALADNKLISENTCTKQSKQAQDFVRFFSIDDHSGGSSSSSSSYFIEVYDGHGSSWLIDRIREGDVDTKSIIARYKDDDPATAFRNIQEEIMAISRVYLLAGEENEISLGLRRWLQVTRAEQLATSGTTLSLAQLILRTKEQDNGDDDDDDDDDDIHEVVCSHVGDSSIFVFKNGELCYRSVDHNYSNEHEQERLTAEGVRGEMVRGHKPNVLSPTTISMVPSPLFRFAAANDSDDHVYSSTCPDAYAMLLAPTQSLGHFDRTSLVPTVQRVRFSRADHIKVVVASDGVTDMLNIDTIAEDMQMLLRGSSSEIVEYASSRWNQEWDLLCFTSALNPPSSSRQRFADIDDICCGVMEYTPVPKNLLFP